MWKRGLLAVLMAAALGLAACHDSAAPPPQSGYYNNDLHGGYPGPSPTAPNRS